ncbi:MAG: hypothetical protein AAB847_01890 [Patescibacteria group bacterium]
MIKNPKIILLIFILAIFSFVNSEFNHVSRRMDQLAEVTRIRKEYKIKPC